MNRTRSTWWRRLALALLAVAGFVAPLAQREADGVVQTTGGKPSAVVAPAAVVLISVSLRERVGVRASPPHDRLLAAGRRWLLHRALLL